MPISVKLALILQTTTYILLIIRSTYLLLLNPFYFHAIKVDNIIKEKFIPKTLNRSVLSPIRNISTTNLVKQANNIDNAIQTLTKALNNQLNELKDENNSNQLNQK